MTRSKTHKRIEDALKHKSEPELQWALSYCKLRLSYLTHKLHEAYWLRLRNQVQKVLDDVQDQE